MQAGEVKQEASGLDALFLQPQLWRAAGLKRPAGLAVPAESYAIAAGIQPRGQGERIHQFFRTQSRTSSVDKSSEDCGDARRGGSTSQPRLQNQLSPPHFVQQQDLGFPAPADCQLMPPPCPPESVYDVSVFERARRRRRTQRAVQRGAGGPTAWQQLAAHIVPPEVEEFEEEHLQLALPAHDGMEQDLGVPPDSIQPCMTAMIVQAFSSVVSASGAPMEANGDAPCTAGEQHPDVKEEAAEQLCSPMACKPEPDDAKRRPGSECGREGSPAADACQTPLMFPGTAKGQDGQQCAGGKRPSETASPRCNSSASSSDHLGLPTLDASDATAHSTSGLAAPLPTGTCA